MLKVRKFQKYVKEASDLEEIYISRFLLKNAKRWSCFCFDRIRIFGIRRLKLRALLQQCKYIDSLRGRFSDVLFNILLIEVLRRWVPRNFLNPSIRALDPQLSAILEEMRLRTDGFNTLYRTDLNNTAGNTGTFSQAFRTDHGYYL